MQTLIEKLVTLTTYAGEAILQVYQQEGHTDVVTKADDSPLTQADLASHKILVEGLKTLTPEVPILSEEGQMPDVSERSQWPRYWLIDPLDGTKEFIHRNGEFTVNVALIEGGQAIAGVVSVPVTGVTYWGAQGLGAYKIQGEQSRRLSARALQPRLDSHEAVDVVSSRRHGDQVVNQLMQRLEQQFEHLAYTTMGSSLKLCLIAEGKADLYPRLAPTSEWDTAAAQAIVEAAGGAVLNMDFEPLRYNTKDSILNPHFWVVADPHYPWHDVLSRSS